MIEVEEILYRWIEGMSTRQIAKSLSVSRHTVRSILAQGKSAGLSIESNLADIATVLPSLRMAQQKVRQVKDGKVENYITQYHSQLEAWLAMPHMTINQIIRLLQKDNKRISETQLRRYVKQHFVQDKRQSTVHLETIAGRQAQVDFAFVGLMLDPLTGKRRKAHAFIMTLSHSRYRFVRFVFKQDIANWIDCHIRAFKFFGGVPVTIMPDNLKSGVSVANLYDPIINRAYGELERHYGFICDPTKVRTPQHKGKVERSVIIVRQQVLAGQNFKDIEEANTYALNWCRHDIAMRTSRSTGQTPWDKFSNEEKAALKPLPATDYECPVWQTLKVHRDHHIVFEGSFYSVPTKYIGEMVWIRAVNNLVEIYYNQERIKSHARSKQRGQWITDEQDYSKKARAFLTNDATECLKQAKQIGSCALELISKVVDKATLVGQRKAQAILRLGEKYGSERLEAACARALVYENYSYQGLKAILNKELDLQEEEVAKTAPSEQTSYLRSVIEFRPISAEGGQ